MPIRCPQCAAPQPLSETEIGAGGLMVRCEACGTRWLARRFADDPYRNPALQLQPLVPRRRRGVDALIIEHIPTSFAKIAPHRREAPAARPVTAGRRGLKTFGAILGAIAVVMIFHAPIVAALPGLASVQGLAGDVGQLKFQNVRSETVQLNGNSTLFVEGEILNTSAGEVRLPAVRVTLKSPDGRQVTSWLVEPSAAALAPGDTIGFRSALASPPEEATQVTLDLALRQDVALNLR